MRLAQPVFGHGPGDAQGVLDRPGTGSAVADDAGAADAQQRAAAEFLVLEPGLEPFQAGGDLGPGVAGKDRA